MCELELRRSIAIIKDGLTEKLAIHKYPPNLSLLCLDFAVPVVIRDSWIEFRRIIRYRRV